LDLFPGSRRYRLSRRRPPEYGLLQRQSDIYGVDRQRDARNVFYNRRHQLCVDRITNLILAAGNHTLTFLSLTEGDNTAFLDDISISAVPEPLSLFGLGLMLMAFVGFKRKRSA
jgi:hypothetical protein